MSEKCVRCGSVGEDRRTLWHACFYAMEELGLPFEQQVLFHADLKDLEKAQEPFKIPNTPIVLHAGTVTCKGELTPQGFYTLRVCKRCRGEWLAALRNWFHAQPEGQDSDADTSAPYNGPGTGIFIREHGTNKEMTREEWDARQQRKQEQP